MKVVPPPGPQGRYSEASETLKVAGLQMRRWAPGYVNEWHPVSQREYTIGVSGVAGDFANVDSANASDGSLRI
jgi:hypothetical protein